MDAANQKLLFDPGCLSVSYKAEGKGLFASLLANVTVSLTEVSMKDTNFKVKGQIGTGLVSISKEAVLPMEVIAGAIMTWK